MKKYDIDADIKKKADIIATWRELKDKDEDFDGDVLMEAVCDYIEQQMQPKHSWPEMSDIMIKALSLFEYQDEATLQEDSWIGRFICGIAMAMEIHYENVFCKLLGIKGRKNIEAFKEIFDRWCIDGREVKPENLKQRILKIRKEFEEMKNNGN